MAEQAAPVNADGIVGGLQQAHSDFRAWHYQPHCVGLFDTFLSQLNANGCKREVVGYGSLVLVALLLFTGFAPLVASLICIVYPIIGTVSVLRGQSKETMRFLAYWAIFGVFSLFDYYFAEMTFYWAIKIVVAVFLYLPQTQGAVFVFKTVVEPVATRGENAICPKSVYLMQQ